MSRRTHRRTTTFSTLLYVACVAVLVLTTACQRSPFERVGYFKGDQNLRYFTFNVVGHEIEDLRTIPEDLLQLISDHGARRLHTTGRITASFYYVNGDAPNITHLSPTRDEGAAREAAHEAAPIVAVWIMPEGEVRVIENPE